MTVTATLEVPAVVGVPVIRPVDERQARWQSGGAVGQGLAGRRVRCVDLQADRGAHGAGLAAWVGDGDGVAAAAVADDGVAELAITTARAVVAPGGLHGEGAGGQRQVGRWRARSLTPCAPGLGAGRDALAVLGHHARPELAAGAKALEQLLQVGRHAVRVTGQNVMLPWALVLWVPH